MTAAPATPRKRGRPPVLRPCVLCKEDKPSMAFRSPRHEACVACEALVGRMTKGGVATDEARASTAEMYAPISNPVTAAIFDTIKLDAARRILTNVVEPVQRCECCWETRHVRRDAYGGSLFVCARCEHQLMERGCCHLHHGRVIYAELAEGKPAMPAPTPLEIELLFTSGAVVREHTPEELAAVEPDL